MKRIALELIDVEYDLIEIVRQMYGDSDMKFKTYVCIQEDCGEICKHESVLAGDRHPKPPEFCPYYGGPCKWEGIDLADVADQPPENLTRDNCFHVSEDGER